MQLNLIDGSFTPTEAEELLRRLIKVKTDFHLEKIDKSDHSEENIKHSERRILALETALRDATEAIRNGSSRHVTMHAVIALSGLKPEPAAHEETAP